MLNKTLIAYHGTLSKYSNKILEDGFKLPQISTTHDHWLGHGVYFFDNFLYADNWAKRKCRAFHDSKSTDVVLQVKICTDSYKIADFDLPGETQKYNEAIENYDKKISQSRKSTSFGKGLNKCDKKFKQKIEKRIDCFYHDLYAKENDLGLAMRTFHKASPLLDTKQNRHSLSHGSYMEYSEKQICVYKLECIVDVLIYDSEVDGIC